MKFYFKKKKRLVNVIVMVFLCYFFRFYEILEGDMFWGSLRGNLKFGNLSDVLIKLASHQLLPSLILTGLVVYLGCSYFLELKKTKFNLLVGQKDKMVLLKSFVEGNLLGTAILGGCYLLLAIILSIFYTFDVLSIFLVLKYFLELIIYGVFVNTFSIFLLSKFSKLQNIRYLVETVSFILFFLDLGFQRFFSTSFSIFTGGNVSILYLAIFILIDIFVFSLINKKGIFNVAYDYRVQTK